MLLTLNTLSISTQALLGLASVQYGNPRDVEIHKELIICSLTYSNLCVTL